jgi:TonB family protein
MAQLPMRGPDADKPGPSSASGGLWISPEELCAPDAPAGLESDLAELAARFSSHGAGLSKELSASLALEIVLNEIVEQACLATGATGAAIVLKRDGELVCRASAGANAPELGVRLDTEAGLSGACVKTHQTQRCDDAQADPRADMEASRWLGIRSVMILPLLRNHDLSKDDLLGVFEVFSSRPFAFGERDERTLQALAQRAFKNLQRASDPLLTRAPVAPPPVKRPPVTPTPVTPTKERRAAEPETRRSESTQVNAPEKATPNEGRKFDGVILALSAAVFVCAVLLSTLVGLHFGWQRAAAGYARAGKAKSRTAASPLRENAVPANVAASPTPAEAAGTAAGDSASAARTPASTGQETSAAQVDPRAPVSKQLSSREPSSRPSGAGAASPAAPPAGSLLVYENGKEVFRMLPSAPGEKQNANTGGVERASSVAPAVGLSPDIMDSRLLHRVEPDYPEEARRQGIQGPVVLDLRIGRDGTVQDVGLVSGQAVLVQAAIAAVKQWQFKPHYVDGREVEMQARITLRFSLPAP